MEECASGYLIPMKLRNKQYVKINRAKLNSNDLNVFIERKLIEFSE